VAKRARLISEKSGKKVKVKREIRILANRPTRKRKRGKETKNPLGILFFSLQKKGVGSESDNLGEKKVNTGGVPLPDLEKKKRSGKESL